MSVASALAYDSWPLRRFEATLCVQAASVGTRENISRRIFVSSIDFLGPGLGLFGDDIALILARQPYATSAPVTRDIGVGRFVRCGQVRAILIFITRDCQLGSITGANGSLARRR